MKTTDMIYQQLNSLLASEETLVVEILTGYRQVSSGWHIKQRSFSEHLIYYICQHLVTGIIAGQHVELAPGSMLWLLPQTSHTFFSSSEKHPPRLYHFRFG